MRSTTVGAETIIVMETFAKTLQDAMPGTKLKRIVLTQIGDLLSDGVINAKGRLLNFVLRRVQKMVLSTACRTPAGCAMCSRRGQGRVQARGCACRGPGLSAVHRRHHGVSKGAMLTHRNVLANCQQALAFAEGQLTDETETVVTLIPMYHIFSLTVNGLIFMALGGRNILVANPRDTERVMMILKNEKFSGITGVSTLFSSFLDDPGFAKLDFSKLQSCPSRAAWP